MKKLFTLFALIFCLTTIKSQFVTIPDANFVTWLQTNVPSAMSGNQMDTTNTEITTTIHIDINSLGITNLTGMQYFDALTSLDCGNMSNSILLNSFSSWPIFPKTLKILSCTSLNLTSLPILPDSLISLNCASNSLTTLPFLPQSLTNLYFYNNLLTSLPILPQSIKYLDCGDNLLTSITNLPNYLVYLYCSNNPLTNISILPPTLNELHCSNCQLTSLPILPNSLSVLNCNFNNITCLPILPNSIQPYYLDFNVNPITCLPNYIPSMNDAQLAYPLCTQSNTLTNPNNCSLFQGIQGSLYNDVDLNCTKTTDQYATNIKIKIFDINNNLLESSYTFGSGQYAFALTTGTYNITIDTTNNAFQILCLNPGLDSLATLTNTITSITNLDFAINCKAGYDVGIQSVTSHGLVFPGQTHALSVVAGDMSRWHNMHCANGISGTITFTVNGQVTYISPAVGSLTPTVLGNIFTYTVTDFGTINNSNDFMLLFNTNTTAQIGDSICVAVSVTPIGGDNNSSNNIYSYCYYVSNSHDPNKKEVYPVNVSPNYHDWFTYTIHFQNTGNAPAINVRIADTLNSNLDLNTFQVINYSHYNQTTLNGNILNVRFPNIQLPDSTSNNAGSQGFIQYRIKPKANLPAGTKISNTAYIYFDFNSPIITNTTINNFIIDLSVKETNLNDNVLVYPNPNNGSFEIETSSLESKNIQIIDITGNIVFEKTIEGLKNTINTSNLANGIYTLKISGANRTATKKLVIVK